MPKEFKYYKIYKPFGMLSQFSKSNPGEKTLADLPFDFPKDVYPVGRLDKDSEGLLLLTNDNRFKQKHTDPLSETPKTYWVQVDGEVDESVLKRFSNGEIRIKLKTGYYNCKPAKARFLEDRIIETIPEREPPIRFRKNIPTTWLEIELKEGKNRQIRKMTAQIGNPTLRLIRVSSSNISLENIQPEDVIAFDLK